MKIKNISKRTYNHSYYGKDNKFETINLAPNAVMDIEEEVAEKWLKTGEVVEYIEPEEAKNLQDENEALKKEIEKLKAEAKNLQDENEALKKEIEKLKAEAKKANASKDNSELEALKKEADELEIQYPKNIGIEALKKKIEAEKAKKAA